MSATPGREELREFLERGVLQARQLGDVERMNDLLDKLSKLDETLAFVQIAVSDV